MIRIHSFTLAVATALAFTTAPSLWAQEFSYSFIEAGYFNTDLDDLDVDGDGFIVGGSAEINETFFVFGGVGQQDFDFDIDLNQWQIGAGGHMPLNETIDVVGSLSYVSAEIDTRFGDVDDDGFGLGIGLRGQVGDAVQLEGGINYIDLDDSGDDTSLALGARYYISPELALGLSIETGDDATTWGVSVRVEF